MPTDGTHLEVIQGLSNAADTVTRQEIGDAGLMRKALLRSEEQSGQAQGEGVRPDDATGRHRGADRLRARARHRLLV